MKTILGLAIIAFGIFLEVMWLGLCFGTVIIGIVLLIFAPAVLFFPFNFFLVLGLAVIRSQTSGFQYKQYSQQEYNYTQARDTLDKYYEILESKKTDSFEVIKANYRRLVKEYHYDSIASKDLPADMVKFAQEKTQSLNEAYAKIKEERS